MTNSARQRFDEFPPSKQAGILCNQADFQKFGSHCLGLEHRLNVSGAAEFQRRQCGIQSRKQLDTNPDARARFNALRTEYDAWRGKIATQR